MMKIKLSAFVAIAVLSWGQATLAAEADHDAAAKAKESSKTETTPSINWKEEYKKLTEAFGKIGASLPVKAVPAVALPDNKDFKEFNLTAAMVGRLTKDVIQDGEKESKEIPSIMKALTQYREKLKKCGKEDAVAKDLAALLDAYVIHLRDTFGDDPTSKKDIKISEKTVNTYTVQIIKLLDKKAEAFKDDKASFEKSDDELKKNLRSLAGILWGSEKGEFKREKTYTEAKMREDKDMKKIVESVDATIKNVEHAAKETDKSVCKMDDSSDEGTSAGDTSTGDDGDTAGPAGADGGDAGDTGGGAGGGNGSGSGSGTGGGAGGGAGGGLGGGIDPGAIGGGTTNPIAGQDLLGDSALAAQLQALQDAIQRAEDQAEFERQRNADLQAERDRDNADNQGLIEALAGLQPDGARSNERSNTEGSPSTQFPSGSGGGDSGGGGEIPPPPEVPQPQPMQPFNPYAMMPQQQQQQLPLELFTRKRDADDAPRRPVVVQDPNSSALLEQLKTQGLILQQLLAQRFQPYAQGVQNVGNALSNFGSRMVRGLSTRRAGSNTMMGSASGGAQGQLAVPGARTPIPSAIFGKR